MRRLTIATALVLILGAGAARAATLPAGFSETFVSGFSSPTAMAVAPDGRVFVCEQGGDLRVIKNGALLATPFLSLTVDSAGERGLLGVAFDPNFVTNQYVYVYYTVPGSPAHNRVRRYTANGDVAVSGSGFTLLDLNNLSSATNHNGGALHFGLDGKLYIAVGENASPSNAQTLTNLLGKMLRINSDGSIPPDNPFVGVAGARERDLGAGASQPVLVRGAAVQRADLHQRRRPEHLGGDRRRGLGRELRVADLRGRLRPAAAASGHHGSLLLLQQHTGTRAPSRAATSITRRHPSSRPRTRATTSSRTTAETGSSGSTPSPGPSRISRRASPLPSTSTSTSRGTCTTSPGTAAASTRSSTPARTRPSSPRTPRASSVGGRDRDLHGGGERRGAAHVPVAEEQLEHRGSDVAVLHDAGPQPRRQRQSIPLHRVERLGQRAPAPRRS